MKQFIMLISIALLGLLSCKESDKLVANDVLKAKALANGTASGTTYYIDPSGSDDSVGTSAGSAWKTLAKINASVFSPGDRILFKSGGVWNDTLHIKSSRASGAAIVLDKYDGEVRPVIHGGGKRR